MQMKCFLSLAKTQKMSETAAIMCLSLSTLSKYIDRMENELSLRGRIKKNTLWQSAKLYRYANFKMKNIHRELSIQKESDDKALYY